MDTASPAGGQPQILRTARALIGWLPEDRAYLLLNSNHANVPTDEQRATVSAAHAAVAARTPGLDQAEVVMPAPPSLDAHVAALRASSAAAPYFGEGWSVALVDLARLVAFQPSIFSDSAAERAEGVDPADPTQIAAISLPTAWETELPLQFDEAHNMWLVISRNPNLRIVGQFAGQTEPGSPPAVGFMITVTPSFLQVARYQGRYFLRDGYHRSFGLLSLGVRWAPALVRDFTSIQELIPQPLGMLSHEDVLGSTPPTLADFADDLVATTVLLPASQKIVVIQALELTPIG